MQIEWIYGLAGGLLIGLGATVFLLMNGRILGASGILGGLVDGSGHHNRNEGIALIAGTILAPAIAVIMGVEFSTNATSNIVILIAAGLLVGIGTRWANGCTSGHGVCGISRLSLRGIAATAVYIAAGGLTIALFRQILGVV